MQQQIQGLDEKLGFIYQKLADREKSVSEVLSTQPEATAAEEEEYYEDEDEYDQHYLTTTTAEIMTQKKMMKIMIKPAGRCN